MSNATASRSGQALAAGATDALFLKMFSGEVLTIFEAENVTKARTMLREIQHGKSAQFPVMGRATAEYHTPGNEILGGTVKHNEKIITIDQMLISPQFIADIDEAMNHYDVRSHYSTEVGRVLAQTWDKHVLQVGVLAARTATANIPGESSAGTIITEAVLADFDDNVKLATAITTAAQTLDEKNVPEMDRVIYLRPADYWNLINNDTLISKDFSANGGDRAAGFIPRIAGMEVVKTTNLPSTNVIASSVAGGSGDDYIGDFSKTRALVMHKSAVGTVKLLDLSVRNDYDPRRLGNQVVAKYAVGHGVLKPESAIEIANL